MHLVFYTHNVLETYGLSTFLSILVLLGSAYGVLQIAAAVFGFLGRVGRPDPPA